MPSSDNDTTKESSSVTISLKKTLSMFGWYHPDDANREAEVRKALDETEEVKAILSVVRSKLKLIKPDKT